MKLIQNFRLKFKSLQFSLKLRLISGLRKLREVTWLKSKLQAVYFEDCLLEMQLEKFGPKFVAKYNTHLFSQSFEDAAIAEIFSRVGTEEKSFIEIGVEDGLQNTSRLLLMLGWKGLWIEGDPLFYEQIQSHFRSEIASGQLKVVNSMVTPDNVQDIIDGAGFNKAVDFISVDIDQHTSHVFRAIKTRARVACVEYNAHFPPTIDYETPYLAGASWDGSKMFGASLKALEVIASQKDMALVGCDLMGLNAYFVDRSLTGDLFPQPFTAENHYQPARYPFVSRVRGHRAITRS